MAGNGELLDAELGGRIAQCIRTSTTEIRTIGLRTGWLIEGAVRRRTRSARPGMTSARRGAGSYRKAGADGSDRRFFGVDKEYALARPIPQAVVGVTDQ